MMKYLITCILLRMMIVMFLKKGRARRLGPPRPYDFEVAENLVQFLKLFYDSTLRFSASSSITVNSCFGELAEIHKVLNQNINCVDPRLASMSKNMKLKFDKYWANLKSTNLLLYIVVVLDPRLKMEYLRFCFKRLMMNEIAGELLEMVYDALTKMYIWFVSNAPSSSGKGVAASTNSAGSTVDESLDSLEAEFKRQMEIESSFECSKTEFEQYLFYAKMVGVENFDIMAWWKLNCCRYPIVSQMAKQVMALPMSTVASESCFSTSARILDVFRSSLAPQTVEALICTQNWIKGAAKKSANAAAAQAAVNEVIVDYNATIEDLGIDLSNVILE